jgi:hypothetical protein
MTKRISRKALALAAVGVLASPALAQVANAQIISKTIAVTLKAVGPLPTGVTGANVSVSCQNTTNNPGAIVSSFALTPGQTANLNNFNLTPVASGSATGSSCSVTVTTTGSANRGVGAITISIGGATDKSGTNSTPGIGYATGGSVIAAGLTNAGALTLTSNTVAVFDSTDVQITLTYPQITVKKVVVGDEATAGFAYPMSIACSNPVSPIFVSPANGLEAGGASSFVSIPVTATTQAVAPSRAFVATAKKDAVWSYGWTQTATTPAPAAANNAAPGGAGVVVQNFLSTVAPSSTVPLASNVFPANVINPSAFILTPAVSASPDTAAVGYTGYGYAAGDIVVPGAKGQNYVLVTYYVPGATATAAPVLSSAYAVFDASNTDAVLPAVAAIGTVAVTSVRGNAAGIATLAIPANAVWNGPTTTPTSTLTLKSGDSVTAVSNANYVLSTLINAASFTVGIAATSTPGFVKVYDYRTNPSTITAPDLLGNWANLGTGNPSLYTQTVNAINSLTSAQPTPNTAGNPSFNGTFTLKAGDSRSFSFNEFPNLTTSSLCEVWETNGGGASVTAFSSTVPAVNNVVQTPLGGLNNANGRFQSNLTKMNETITVTNSFLGDMIISKVVTGDPKTNVATYEISVACDKGGPKDTFLIKDRQSKVYSSIASGTNCLITETKSDGAVASYKDNSGDNTTDGRVTIKRRPIGGCGDVLGLTGAPTNATPGGPAPTTTFNECWASVIITNDYNPVAAPETTKAAAAAPATAAPATAAPAVAPAPAVAVDATPTFAG